MAGPPGVDPPPGPGAGFPGHLPDLPPQLPPWPAAEIDPPPPPRRLRAGERLSIIVCWTIIALIAVGLPLARVLGERSQARATGSLPAATQPKDSPGESIDFQTDVVGRYTLAAAKFQKGESGALLSAMAGQMHDRPGRLASGVMTVEIGDREQGLKQIELSGAADAPAFERLYRQAVPLPPEVQARYGFFARLAAVADLPPGDGKRIAVLAEAHRVILIGAAAFVIIGGLGVVGLGLLITAAILAGMDKLKLRVRPPLGRPSVYVEAFTVYLLGFLLGSLLIQILMPHATLAVHGAMMAAAVLAAVAWPTIRGESWALQRADWGLHVGGGLPIEMCWGVAGYITGLPVVGVGTLLTLLLGKLAAAAPATNPAVQLMAAHPLFVFGLATIFAPLTEETLFRGALLSHLRAGLGAAWAALLTGLVFAAVHPQGWIAIPALASIGFVLAMIRQWRGSLAASMTAHALNNATVLLIVLLIT